MKLLTSLILCLLLAVNYTAFGAEQYAVVIGVSNYPYLDKRFNLVGPRNDALLVNQYLQQRGMPKKNIHLLTEDHPDAKPPTRENIFSSIESILAKGKPGDFLYLHFSGHGSQQPALSGTDEIDGLDETFLPADTKNWNDKIQSVENIITDDDIAAYLSRLSAKQIFVWLVFDSCHSGTMTRNQWRSREVKPRLLGIPPLQTAKYSGKGQARGTGARMPTPVEMPTTKGADYVAFFAAQTNEETPEMALPRKAEGKKTYGLFTFHLIQALSRYPNASYRQIAEQIFQNYNAQPWFGSRPMFVGSGLDQPNFGADPQASAAGAPQQQWQINRHADGFEIAAGFLQGLTVGTRLAVLTSPADDDVKAIAEAVVMETSALVSQIKFDQTNLPDQSYARLLESTLDLSLSLSMLNSPFKTSKPVESIIAGIKKDGIGRLLINWVSEDEHADIRLFATKDALILLTDGEPLPCLNTTCTTTRDRAYIRIKTNNIVEAQTNLTEHLQTIAKAMNLMRLGTELGSDALEAELIVKQAASGQIHKYSSIDMPTLYAGDEVSINIANYLEAPLDITILFIGSDYSVNVIFPRRNTFNRFMEEEEKTIRLGRINAKTTGIERLVVIATQATRGAVASNYGFLAQQGISKSRNTSAMANLFLQAGFGQGKKSRSSMPISNSLKSQGDIKTLSWITSP